MIVSELIEELQKLDQDLEVWAFPGCSCYPVQPMEPGFETKEVVDWAERQPYSLMDRIRKTVLVLD